MTSKAKQESDFFEDIAEKDLFNPADMEEFRIELGFKNLTAGTQVQDPSKLFVLELLRDGLIIDLPQKNCASGHQVELRIVVYPQTPVKIDFHATARVEQLDSFEDKKDQARLRFLQFDEPSWEALLRMHSDRQEKAEQFLKSSKGLL